MKKDEALDKLQVAGHTIHNLNASAWNTALHPTRYGWASSIFSIASIPVLSAASIGHMVASAATSQINPDTFEKITTLGQGGGDTGSTTEEKK
jgi:hypothetical protein